MTDNSNLNLNRDSISGNNISTNLLSDDDLDSAVHLGVNGAMIGLPLETLPAASEILTWKGREGKTQEWAEQYRAVAVHCYQSAVEAGLGSSDPFAQFLNSIFGGGMAEDDEADALLGA